MPEFQLDTSKPATVDFSDLSDFAQGYVEAMFFCAQGDEDGMAAATFADLSLDALARIVADCDAFGSRQVRLCRPKSGRVFFGPSGTEMIRQAVDSAPDDYSETKAGRDFWFGRCGHGVGFWDRGLGEVGDRLHKLAESFGNLDPYMGDDGKVYLG